MRIRAKSKAKKAMLQQLATRTRVTVDRYYNWQDYQAEEPPSGYIETTDRWAEQVNPQVPRPTTRIPVHTSLSRRQLRRRVSAAGLRGKQLRQIVDEIVRGPAAGDSGQHHGYRILGWPESLLKEHLGRRLFRAVTRHAYRMLVVLDELGYFMPQGLSKLYSQARSLGFSPILHQQDAVPLISADAAGQIT